MRLFLIADIAVDTPETARQRLDNFREAVMPSSEWGITLYQDPDQDPIPLADCGCPICPQCNRPGCALPDCNFNMSLDHGLCAEACAARGGV